MDTNLDQGSAVECTVAYPRLTKSPEEEEKSVYFFLYRCFYYIGREIQCLPYAGFFLSTFADPPLPRPLSTFIDINNIFFLLSIY